MRNWWMATVLLAGLTWSIHAQSQALPAPDREAVGHESAQPRRDDGYPTHAWTLAPIEVKGQNRTQLREEDHVGDYEQPRWTAYRRFPSTRTYVVPSGTLTLEYWNQYNQPLASHKDRRVRAYYEAEIGLGHRLQLDLYLITEQHGYAQPSEIKKESIEVRYALADWGRLWGNPTLYVEWVRENGGPDALEGKLLLAGEVASGYHAGINLAVERALGADFGHEYQISAGLSRTLSDQALSLGLEGRFEFHDAAGKRLMNLFDQAALVGPSLSWSPVPPMHLLWSVLAGPVKGELNPSESGWGGAVESWLVLGFTL